MNYKDTLLMPKTDFEMRGNLGKREPEIQKHWESIDLYNKVLEKNKDNTPFVLHDGPPYANNNIHIGHAFQKTLKDFVLRYQTMSGRYTPYIPGWDTHGLPIENEVTKSGVDRKQLTRAEFRKICREYAIKQVEVQRAQFKRLGILGDWDNPYLTLDKSYIADQVRVFSQMVDKGIIYKGLKPIYWSPSSESAFAEAEIEYMDKQSKSIYVGFDMMGDKFPNTKLLIWTTTPWTLPANLAVSVHPNFDYVWFNNDGKNYIALKELLPKLVEKLGFSHAKVLKEFKGSTLEFMNYKHPLYDRVSPIILGEHVTAEDGTGLVHTAPGHGEDDYFVGKKYNLDLLSPVDEKGHMTEEAGPYAGMFYEKANAQIVEDLRENGHLLYDETITHSYPHDWRTKKPVIFRSTPQWFASIDMLKGDLLEAIKGVKWHTSWGEVRLTNMIKDRNDWVISRQRVWGVPIPIFYDNENNPLLDRKLIDHVASLFEVHGSDIWYEWDVEKLLPSDYEGPRDLTKELDIMDVWFDSGTSYNILKRRGLPFPADMYLEGSDQYRGWFNSSLTTAIAVDGVSPYKEIVSHGFVLDGKGRKMSKSLGNVIDPLTVMNDQGADVLRLWVASVDYEADVRISKDLMKQVSESYRKFRNTFRFMLGVLDGFNPEVNYIGWSMRGQLNRVMTDKYYVLATKVNESYAKYNFVEVTRLIIPFVVNDLSAFYLDYTKDSLYCDAEDDFERRAIQSTIYDILLGLLRLLTPIMPHTTSEAYDSLKYKEYDNIYLEKMPIGGKLKEPKLQENYDIFDELRNHVLKHLELAREAKVIGKSLDAHLDLSVDQTTYDALEYLDLLNKLDKILIVSSVHITKADQLDIKVSKADGHVCARCWNIVKEVNQNYVCVRCESVLEGLK
ncbi:isoleucine--tRNA ligase [Acholeplasma laidlawii]|uniref:isoleucine--tRNA ligase n=1 Tax=Acholeplasma laidlawii TaxID=2148 RepID=UPI000B52606C|nr:isoleucine--tRNA ligase [Acholeplasma laidlawii]NWH10104.1 isoleucine--tRNA ligase [Acholeplasma laidlawii]OWU87937.1 isoleucine--tRNA ligase [Acholeplasma laidlawii]